MNPAMNLIFEDFVYVLKKQLWTKFPMDLIRNVPLYSKMHSFISVETMVVKLL